MARGLTLKDLEPSTEESAVPVAAQPAQSSVRRLVLSDIAQAKDVVEEPFEGGSTLKMTVPLPGNWPTLDTGIPISKAAAQTLAGAGKRFVDVQNRAKQGINKLVPSAFPNIQATIDADSADSRPLMQTTPAILGQMLPDIALSAALPTKLAGLLSTTRGAMAQGMAQGLATPVTSDEKNGTATNVVLGGISAPIANAAAKGVGSLAGKVAHAAPALIPDSARVLAKRLGVKLPEVNWTDAEKLRLYNLAKAKGVPTTIGDIDPASEWASIENANRPFWSGRSGDMQRQQNATRQVLEDTVNGIATTPAGAEGSTIVKGVLDKFDQAKKSASTKFKGVADIAGRSPGLTPIKPDRAKMATDSALADYPELFDEFKNNATLKKMMGLAEDTGSQAGRIINPATSNNIEKMTPFKYPQELGFDDAQFLRKRLGAWYDKLHTQFENGTLPPGLDGEAVKHAATIFSAFNKDLDAWGNQAGNSALNKAWKDARQFYKAEVMPFRDPRKLDSKSTMIRNIVNGNIDVDTVANKALSTQETSIAKDLMAHSTPAGQAAMKSALVRKMVDPSISPDIAGLGNASLLRNTTKQTHAGDYVFDAVEQGKIQDARDIAKLTRRSAEAGTTPPPTGARTLPFLAASTLPAVAGTTYMGLGMLGDSIDPATRIALSGIAAPIGALSVMNGLNRYAGSALGKHMYFAKPKLAGGLGWLQDITQRAVRSAGQPLEETYVRGELGHRE